LGYFLINHSSSNSQRSEEITGPPNMCTKRFYQGVVHTAVIAFFVLVGLVATVSVSRGQTPTWSQPIPLSASDTSSWFPDVAADAAGQVHVVWSSSIGMVDRNGHPVPGYDVVMYTTSSNGQTWTKAIDIAALAQTAGSEATRPTALVDRQGMLHMTFRGTDVFYLHAPVESLLSAVHQLSPRKVSTANIAYFSRLALDGHGKLHLVYSQMVPGGTDSECPNCYHLFHRWSDDNGLNWSAPTDVSVLSTGAAKPQIVVDGQGAIHLVWEAGIGGAYGRVTGSRHAVYAASYDGGKTWTSPAEFVAPGGEASNISLGLDGQDKLIVAWLGLPEDVVYYQFSRDQGHSWSPPQPIPGLWGGFSVYGTALDDYTMATDSAGSVHLALVGRTAADQKTLSVLHLAWDGNAWSKPEAITTLTGDVPEWPRIAVGLGNQLHVVWFVRDAANVWKSESGQYKVWYARAAFSAPPATPVVWPTPTQTPTPKAVTSPVPMPSPTLLPTLTPTLDPGLTQASVPAGAIDSIYTDMDEITSLVISLVPAGLVIVAVVIGIRIRRH
jgi:hypothetical protein